jgi:hypothetical protein
MITDEEDSVQARVMPLEITWRNPLTLVRAHLRVKESSNLLRMGGASQKDSRTSRELGRLSLLGSVNTANCRESRLSP